MNTKLGPILTKTNIINFMTKIGLRLGMLVNTKPEISVLICSKCSRILESVVGTCVDVMTD